MTTPPARRTFAPLMQRVHYAEFAALLPPNRIRCLKRRNESLLKQTRLRFSLLLAGFAGVVDAEFDSAE